jgi:hypothetical protein
LATILKVHSAAALAALRSDLANLADGAAVSTSLDADIIRNVAIQIAPEPESYPFAIELPWPQMHLPLRVCLASSANYDGDAILYGQADARDNTSALVLEGMSSLHVATLLEAIENSTTLDMPNGVMRQDLHPAGEPVAGALVQQSLLPDVAHALRQAFYLSRLAKHHAQAKRHFAWFDSKSDTMKPDVKAFAEANDFTVYHSGGGCLALIREEAPDWHILYTGDDAVLPESLTGPECTFGIHHNETGWWLSTTVDAIDFMQIRKTLLALAAHMHDAGEGEIHTEIAPALQKAKHLGVVDASEAAHVDLMLGRPAS